jgi:hypothetical protein
MLGALVLGLAMVVAAHAHALYIVPKGDHVIVVFSDNLEPDARIKDATWKRLGGLKLTSRGEVLGAATVTMEKDHLRVLVPAGDRVITGEAVYVSPGKGDAKARGLRFHPRAIIGAIPADGGAIGGSCPLEVVPKVEAGKVRFQVLAAGKPVAGAKVAVLVPEKKEPADATTDEAGWTPAFEAKGRYGVTVRREEAKGGEVNGETFETTTHVATLVVDVK